MKVSKAEKIWLDYHHIHSKKNTVRCYSAVVGKLCEKFGDQQFSELSVENVLGFAYSERSRTRFRFIANSVPIHPEQHSG